MTVVTDCDSHKASHPVWGAWIEMGLSLVINSKDMSHPVWGAWIEILLDQILTPFCILSHPVWGAWIEIHQ